MIPSAGQHWQVFELVALLFEQEVKPAAFVEQELSFEAPPVASAEQEQHVEIHVEPGAQGCLQVLPEQVSGLYRGFCIPDWSEAADDQVKCMFLA